MNKIKTPWFRTENITESLIKYFVIVWATQKEKERKKMNNASSKQIKNVEMLAWE